MESHLSENHVLRIECADAKGLVHKITGVLYREGLNIIENGEFVDTQIHRFFMRSEVSGKADTPKILSGLRSVLPANSMIELTPERKKNIVLFATKESHCLGDLLLRQAYGELSAKVLAVISNHKTLAPLARQFGIPYFCVSAERKSRAAQEAVILKIIQKLKPEYIVLAKYMRVLSDKFESRFRNQIINIHRS